MNLDYLSVTQQAKMLADGEVSSRELTQHCLDRITRYNADMKAFVNVLVDDAMAQADALDETLAKTGRPVGPLHGVPMCIKDEDAVKGVRQGYGTNAVSTPAPDDCEAVRRLREAGAVFVGITAMPEFGQWPFTESTTHGYTRNPWNRERSVHGSSGGTAAAVSSGMVAAGMGGDGGGSIRLPAAWCNLFGLKVQRGRVSSAPAAALWRGLGVVGPLTHTVADSALINDVIASHLPIDKYEAGPWPEPLSAALTRDPGPLRILLAEKPAAGGSQLEAQQRDALYRVGKMLEDAGHHVDTGDLPKYKPGLAMIGEMAGGVTDELKLIEHPKRLELRTRHAAPLFRLLAPLSDSSERKADKVAAQVFTVFDRYDLLLTPTTPTPPLPLGVINGHGLLHTIMVSLKYTAYTAIWNVLGNPAAAIPAGFTTDGLPLSVQLVGAPNSEPLIVQVARQIEDALPWADKHPQLG